MTSIFHNPYNLLNGLAQKNTYKQEARVISAAGFTPLLKCPAVLPRGYRRSGSYLPRRSTLRGQVTGFTLIELVIVVAIMGVLAAVGLVSFMNSRTSGELAGTGQGLISVLRLAQSKALAGEHNTVWGVRLEEDRYILFSGTDYLSSATTQVFALPSSLEITNIDLAGGGQEIVFKKITGHTDQFGSFYISVKNNGKIFPVTVTSAGKSYSVSERDLEGDSRLTDARHREFNLGWSIKDANTIDLIFLNPPQPNEVFSVFMEPYFNLGRTKFDWSGSPVVWGETQEIRIHTVEISDTNTILHVDRDCRKNSKGVRIEIDGKEIAAYDADCATVDVGMFGGTMTEP